MNKQQRAYQFIASVARRYPHHPFVKRVFIINKTTQIELSAEHERVHIDGVFVFDHARGKGEASKALRALIALADEQGVPCSVTPQAFGCGGLTEVHLKAWYARHGFIEQADDLMIRLPAKPNAKLGYRAV